MAYNIFHLTVKKIANKNKECSLNIMANPSSRHTLIIT